MSSNGSARPRMARSQLGRATLVRFREGILLARSTDDLIDLERRLGPIDEDDPAAEELCFELRMAACHLSRGPAPARDRFTLVRPLPGRMRRSFTVKGRIGDRIASVVWADGRLYGSLYALARLEARPADIGHPDHALAAIVAAFEAVMEAPTAPSDATTIVRAQRPARVRAPVGS